MQEQLRDEIHHLLEQVDQQEAPHASPDGGGSQAQQSQMPPRVVNLYLIDDLLPRAVEAAPGEEPMWTVESILGPQREEEAEVLPRQTEQEEASSTPPFEPAPPSSSTQGLPVRLWIALCLCLLALLLGAIAYTMLFLLATADVTIIPTTTTIQTTTSVEVQARALSTLTLSQVQTVPTTGAGHQQAQVGHGPLTFYNAAPVVQTIAAGTLLQGADGVEVVTEQDAVIPAGDLATNGAVTVPAHALQAGPAGNIQAGDIYGACCRLNVFVANGAFTGGQNARSFPMVTQGDLDSVTTALSMSLHESVQAALQAQLHQGEALAPPTCTTTTKSDHQAGQEATQVSVTVTKICTAEAYHSQDLQAPVTQRLSQEAGTQLGEGYSMASSTPQTSILDASSKGSTLHLQVKATGTWAYQFSEAQLHTLSSKIAGKTTEQATTLLLRERGVSQVMLHLSGDKTTLPLDAGNIHLLVMYTSMQQ